VKVKKRILLYIAAGDLELSLSLTGFMMNLPGAFICWRSEAQRGVTLSSSKAKYVAILEAVKINSYPLLVAEEHVH
jgi:hypothetical protein